MKLLKLFLLGAVVCSGLQLAAGTIIYRPNKEAEPKRVSNAKIISIEKGIMTIEIDGGRERLSLSKIEGYYDTDIKNASDGFDDNSPEYRVNVKNIKAPERAQRKSGDKFVNEVFKIDYSISPVVDPDQPRDNNSVKYPFFYLYVMTEYSNEEGGERPIYLIYHPKVANPSKKVYDKAAILEKVLSSKRTNLHKYNNVGNQLLSNSWDRELSLPLTSIKNKRAKIVAWHLEIWGKTDIVYEKDWNMPGSRVSKDWWHRLWK